MSVQCSKETNLTVVANRTKLALISISSALWHIPQAHYTRQETVITPITDVNNWLMKYLPQQATVSVCCL